VARKQTVVFKSDGTTRVWGVAQRQMGTDRSPSTLLKQRVVMASLNGLLEWDGTTWQSMPTHPAFLQLARSGTTPFARCWCVLKKTARGSAADGIGVPLL